MPVRLSRRRSSSCSRLPVRHRPGHGINAMKRAGGNPCFGCQIPIRDIDDCGVLVLADLRLLTKSYGKLFLDSLPPMTRTRRLERVQKFFAWAGRDRQLKMA